MRASGWVTKAAAVSALVLWTFGGGGPAQSADDTSPAAAAPAPGVMQPGDIAVTGFSGTMLAADKLPPGVDPIDRTFIDPNGPALRVFDASNLGEPPSGTLVDVPVRLDVPASQVGQVFGFAYDNGTASAPPNLYVAATSAFGLNIVGGSLAADGKPVRLKAGAPDAVFMEGQFGSVGSASPSAIYKIDGTTGAPSYFADTSFAGGANAGPGIGGLAFDAESRSLYASDLDTGLIHRFALDYNAADLSQYDHGVAGRRAKGLEPIADDGIRLQILDPAFKPDDPTTWGITQPERRIDAMAVRDDRLYYAVADGPEIWSVGLQGGGFGDDARLELKVKAQNPYPVTSMVFDGNGRMLLAQRGPMRSPYDYGSFADAGAEVLRYTAKPPGDAQTDERWQPEPATYAVGTADDGRGADGGVSLQYAYKPDGTLDTGMCDASVVMSGDALTPKANGVQINGIDLVRPANVPPSKSAFITYDKRDDDPAVRGHVGNVATMRHCGSDAVFPPVEGSAEGMPPVEGEGMPPVEGGGEAMPPVEGGGGVTMPPIEDTPTEPGFPETEDGSGESAEAGGISITKSPGQGPCSEKGGCSFNIDITNNSGADLPEITVGDELTAGAANLAGATVEGAAPQPWTCTAPPKFTCTHKGAIKDGETVSLPLSFTPKGIGQEKSLKNCATVQAGGAAAPVEVPKANGLEIGGLKVEAKAVSGSCASGVPCEWEIIATNTGAVPLSGELEVRQGNTIRSAGNNVRPATVQLITPPASPGTTCTVDDNQKTVFCKNPQTTIAPGASQSFKFTVKADAPPGVPIDFFQSDVLVAIGKFSGTKDDPPKITSSTAVAFMPLTPPAGQGGAGAAAPVGPVCASLPVGDDDGEQPAEGGKTQSGPITIEKTPTTTSCDAKTPCGFDITVSNTSNADIPGRITIADTFPPDVKLTTPVLPWSCEPEKAVGTTIPCSHPGPIPANGSLPPLKFTFPPPVGATTVENCATLGAPLPDGIPAPEKPACATIPVPTPVQPAVQPPLSITKGGVAQCSDLGGGCNFTIDVTNDGDVPFIGDVVINEEPTADNIFIEGTKLVKPTGGWTCDPAGTAFTCKSGKVEIAPKKKITLDVGVLLGKLTGANQMQNCASIVGQANRACVTAQLVNGPKLALKKEMLGDGTCAPFCTARITLTNSGNQPVAPPVKIIDILPGTTDALLDTVINHSGGNLDCSKLHQNAIICNLTTPLDPGKEVFVDLGLRMNAVDVAGENCVQLADTSTADPPSKSLRTCVPMSVKRPAGPNLEITKQAPGAKVPSDEGHCDLKGVCTFTITIKNTGTAPFTDKIKVTDSISGGVAELIEKFPVGTARWECGTVKNGPASPFPSNSTECELTPQPGGLQPGMSEVLLINVKPGATWKGSNKLQNCAEISNPAADIGPTGTVKDCAKAKLDPFDVGVTKTGDQNCQPGSECRFELDIFNPGQILHDDPVTIADKLTGLSSVQIVSITPQSGADPFPCSPAPTQIPFTCSGHMKLDIGEHNKYVMIVRLPADASAGSFSNCASVKKARSDDGGANSCHTVQTKPPTTPTEPARCTGGMILLPEGECACPPKTTWNGRSCQRDPPPETGPRPTCPRSRPIGIYPNCCERGTHFDDGVCRRDTKPPETAPPPSCPRSRPIGIYPNCCERGTHFDDGVCRRDTKPPETGPPPACPRSRPIGTYPNCCERGTHFDDGVCRRDTKPTDTGPPPSCPRSRPIGTYPNCCERGTHYDNGVCKRDAKPTDTGPPPSCPRGRPIGTYPNCCGRGTHYDNGVCKRDAGKDDGGPGNVTVGVCKPPRPVGTYPKCCPVGTKYDDGKCRSIACPQGMTGKPPNCCPPGSRFENGKCVRPKSTAPCTGGRVGSPPNCSCPPGTHWARSERCVADALSKPENPPTKTETSKGKCSGGRRGTPPNCFCLPPSKFIGGRCRHIPKPAQQKNDDKVIVK